MCAHAGARAFMCMCVLQAEKELKRQQTEKLKRQQAEEEELKRQQTEEERKRQLAEEEETKTQQAKEEPVLQRAHMWACRLHP